MDLLHYRDLAALGYTDDELKAIAAQKQVTDGPNDQGDMSSARRAGRRLRTALSPTSRRRARRITARFRDLSLIIKSRAGGVDYCYGLLTGFVTPRPTSSSATA